MIRDEARILGWPLAILFWPVFLLRQYRGVEKVPNYYGEKAEAFERNEIYANCGDCGAMRLHYEVVWLSPYCETRECSSCGYIVEL